MTEEQIKECWSIVVEIMKSLKTKQEQENFAIEMYYAVIEAKVCRAIKVYEYARGTHS